MHRPALKWFLARIVFGREFIANNLASDESGFSSAEAAGPIESRQLAIEIANQQICPKFTHQTNCLKISSYGAQYLTFLRTFAEGFGSYHTLIDLALPQPGARGRFV